VGQACAVNWHSTQVKVIKRNGASCITIYEKIRLKNTYKSSFWTFKVNGLKIKQLEAKDLAGQCLGFLIFNVSALSSEGDMRNEGGMKDISSADLFWLEHS